VEGNLPRATSAMNITPMIDVLLVRLLINTQDVAPTELEARLREVFETRTDKTLFLMAAGTLRYGEIVQVIDAAKGAGVQRVGVVTESMRRQ
jgi:biopolymer transport protein ExbD